MATAVAKNLHFDMARVLDVFLQKDAGFLEVGACQPLHRLEGLHQFVGAPDQAHADAAAAGRALQHHRVADARGLGLGVAGVGEQTGTRQQRHLVVLGEIARGVLQAKCAHLRRARPDEGDAGGGAVLGEAGVLGQEAVAGMDGLCPGGARNLEDFFRTQIALRRRCGADFDGHVGQPHVQRMAIRLGIHSNRFHAHATQGADDAAGDGATVGDEYGVEHGALSGGPSRAYTRRGGSSRLRAGAQSQIRS